METLSPWALGTVDDLLRHLNRTASGDESEQDAAVVAGNRAIGWMERRTARKLRARTYRDAETITGTWLTTARTVSGTGFTSTVKAHDQILAAGLQAGTRVVSVDSAVQITLSETPGTAGTGASMTVGSEPLMVSGDGSQELYIPEFPVISVYSASYLDESGTATALTLTGARLEKATGRYFLTQDSFPAGDLNIEIACLAGYLPPSGTVAWDEDWQALKRLWLRVAEIIFQDAQTLMGRRTTRNLAQSDVSYEWKMPDDVEHAIEAYARKP